MTDLSLDPVATHRLVVDADREAALLGQAAVRLLDGGQRQAAALLLDVDRAYPFVDSSDLTRGPTPKWMLVADAATLPLFDGKLLGAVCDALVAVYRAAFPDRAYRVGWVERVASDDGTRWRTEVAGRLGMNDRPTNQSRFGSRSARVTHDGLWFANQAEVEVYEAFRRAQRDPRFLSPGFAVLPGPVWTMPDGTREPDLVVVYGGRVGIVEVDGGVHAGRRSSDKARERQFDRIGVAFIDRIDAEATRCAAEVDVWVAEFLRILGLRNPPSMPRP